jgi:hypothetical protein
MATQDTTATAAEIVSGGQYPDYGSDTGEYDTVHDIIIRIVDKGFRFRFHSPYLIL